MNKKFIALILSGIMVCANVLTVFAEKKETIIYNSWDNVNELGNVMRESGISARNTTVDEYEINGRKYAYVALSKGDGTSGEGICVYDITDTSDIVQIQKKTDIITKIYNGQFKIKDGYLYAVNKTDRDNDLMCYKIQDDGSISDNGKKIEDGGNGIDIVRIEGDYLFYAKAGTNGRNISIYDISDTQNPIKVGSTKDNYGAYCISVEKVSEDLYRIYYISRTDLNVGGTKPGNNGWQFAISDMNISDDRSVSITDRYEGADNSVFTNISNITDIALIGNEKICLTFGFNGAYARMIADVSNPDNPIFENLGEARALSALNMNDRYYAIGSQNGNIIVYDKTDNSEIHSIAVNSQVYDMDLFDGKLLVAGEGVFLLYDLYSTVSVDVDRVDEVNDGMINFSAEVEMKTEDRLFINIFGNKIDVTDYIHNGSLSYSMRADVPDGNYNAEFLIDRNGTVILSDTIEITVKKTMPLRLSGYDFSIGTSSVNVTAENTHNADTGEATIFLTIYDRNGSMLKSYKSAIPSLSKGDSANSTIELSEAIADNQVVKMFAVNNDGMVISDIIRTSEQRFNFKGEQIPAATVGKVNLIASVNSETGILEISGKSPIEKENIIFACIYKPEPDDEKLDYVNAFVSSSDGGFYLEYPLIDAVEGKNYSIEVFAGTDTVLSGKKFVSYYNQNTIDKALLAVKNADKNTFETLINDNEYKNIYNLDMTIYNTLEETYKLSVNEAVSGVLYNDIASLNLAFDNAVAAQKQIMDKDRGIKAAIEQINSATLQDIETVFNDVRSMLDIEFNDLYNEYNDDMKTALYKNWIYRKAFENVTEIKEALENGIAVEYLNYAQYKSVVDGGIIEKYASELGINDTNKNNFKSYSKSVQYTIVKDLLSKSPNNKSNINLYLQEAIQNYKNKPQGSGTSKSNSSGGSGGGTGGISIAPVTSRNEEINKEELIPQTSIELDNKNKFKDVSVDDWYFEAVINLANQKIVEGITDTEFRANQNVKREEFVKMLVAAYNVTDFNATCDFADVISDRWYYSYVATAKKMGFVDGISGDLFGVGMDITREDMAKIVYNVINIMGTKLEEQQETKYTDSNLISDYAVESVEKLSAYGIINGFEDGTFRPKQNVTRAMAAQVIYALLK